MNELRKYEIAAQIQEEAERRTEKQEIREDSEQLKTISTSLALNRLNETIINRSIRKIIGEALIEDVIPPAYSSYDGLEDKTPKKIKDSINIVNVINNLLYQIENLYSPYNKTDEEIKRILLDNNNKTINVCVRKLNDIWSIEEKESKEEKKEFSKEEVTDVVNQAISFLTKNEEIISPAGEVFIVEEFNDSMSRVRNKITNKKYNIETKILKSWIKENKNVG